MIYLHLGAHKTATTYLQTRMALNRGRIFRAGRAYWPIEFLRPRIEHGLTVSRNRQAARLGTLQHLFARSDPFSELRRMCQVSKPVILSEENILGHASSCLSGELYTDAEWRLGRISAALGQQDFSIMLCVRSYPDFIASIYAEALRHGYYMPIETMVERSASLAGQWTNLVDIVLAHFPGAIIIIWQYEEFHALEGKVLKELTGMTDSELLPLGLEHVRPSASVYAVELQADQAKTMSRHERIMTMSALEESHPIAKSGRFDPWQDDQRANMMKAYRRDLEELASRSRVRMLRP